MSIIRRFILTISLLMFVCQMQLQAGILAGSTRIIFKENMREKSLMLVNTNRYPILSQIWVDDGSNNPDYKNSPFLILPAIFKMPTHAVQGIRIIYNGSQLAQDRESVFWLNLYEIPALKKTAIQQDYLNLAMNTQLKIFYRPNTLKTISIDDLAKKLSFKIVRDHNQFAIEITNPTAFYISIIDLKLTHQDAQSNLSNPTEMMIKPMNKNIYYLENKDFNFQTNNQLEYILIDDEGQQHRYNNFIKSTDF